MNCRRLDWGPKILKQNATREICGSANQMLMRGLPVAIGMLQGPVVSICPHATTGWTFMLNPFLLIGQDLHLSSACNLSRSYACYMLVLHADAAYLALTVRQTAHAHVNGVSC